MFSQVCKLYTKFCNPSDRERLYGKRMSDDVFIKHKKEDDYLEKNHQAILQLVEDYPLEVLRSMDETEIDQLAKKFSDLLIISLCNYPWEDRFHREVYLVDRTICQSDYPLASTFRKQFGHHTRYVMYADIRCERSLNIKSLLSVLYIP